MPERRTRRATLAVNLALLAVVTTGAWPSWRSASGSPSATPTRRCSTQPNPDWIVQFRPDLDLLLHSEQSGQQVRFRTDGRGNRIGEEPAKTGGRRVVVYGELEHCRPLLALRGDLPGPARRRARAGPRGDQRRRGRLRPRPGAAADGKGVRRAPAEPRDLPPVPRQRLWRPRPGPARGRGRWSAGPHRTQGDGPGLRAPAAPRGRVPDGALPAPRLRPAPAVAAAFQALQGAGPVPAAAPGHARLR